MASHRMSPDRSPILAGRQKPPCSAAPGGCLGPQGDPTWCLWKSGGSPFLSLSCCGNQLQRHDGGGEGGRPSSCHRVTEDPLLACVSPQLPPPNLGSFLFSLHRKIPPPGTSGTTWRAGVQYRESAGWDPLYLLAGPAEVLKGGTQPPSGERYCRGKIYNLSGDFLQVSRLQRPLAGSLSVCESWKRRVCLGFCPFPSLTGKRSKKICSIREMIQLQRNGTEKINRPRVVMENLFKSPDLNVIKYSFKSLFQIFQRGDV